MTKKKLENTKEIYFIYNPSNSKNIILLKDKNKTGKRYTIKAAYDLIITIANSYPSIICSFEQEAEDKIRKYAQTTNKSQKPIDILKQSKLEILADN